jgi:tRNA nucleotidyltransferase (CCA-adding enzyme)
MRSQTPVAVFTLPVGPSETLLPVKSTDELAEALRGAYPELKAVRDVAGDASVYLVGGAVRDLLLGRERADIDLVVEGDAAALALALGGADVEHERFATVKATLDGHGVDIATARSETYQQAGSLPEVTPATLTEDLGRRDFTINAMALPLSGEPDLIDPYGGEADLRAGLLRVLHSRSFIDDPTRALRAARYAARFGFQPEPETASLLREADLSTVSADRREAELLRVAAEREAPRAFELLDQWGLVDPVEGGLDLAAEVLALISSRPWDALAERERVVLAAVLGPRGEETELAARHPNSPSEGVEIARAYGPIELALARAMGAEWLDSYLQQWRSVELEIDGSDLIAAGVPEGAALGRGLREALHLKLDGEIDGREQELETALAAARRPDEVE